MYAKVFNLKFVKPTDEKVASSYFAENLAKFIRPCNMQSISISLGPCGSLTVTAKFDSGSDLKMFESKSKSVFDDIRHHSISFKPTTRAFISIHLRLKMLRLKSR